MIIIKEIIKTKIKFEKDDEVFEVIDNNLDKNFKEKLKCFLKNYSGLKDMVQEILEDNHAEVLSFIYKVEAKININELVEKIINIYPEGGVVDINVEMILN